MSTATVPTDRPGRLRRRTLRTTLAITAAGAVGMVTTACVPTDNYEAVERWWHNHMDCASRIIDRESGWNADAVSPGGGNIGLFQINKVHASWIQDRYGWSFSELKDPNKNARVAKALSNQAYDYYGDRWQPWRLDGKPRPSGCPA